MSSVSDIKLIRTDTTLDLSQKAEKRCTVHILARIYTEHNTETLVFEIKQNHTITISLSSHQPSPALPGPV